MVYSGYHYQLLSAQSIIYMVSCISKVVASLTDERCAHRCLALYRSTEHWHKIVRPALYRNSGLTEQNSCSQLGTPCR